MPHGVNNNACACFAVWHTQANTDCHSPPKLPQAAVTTKQQTLSEGRTPPTHTHSCTTQFTTQLQSPLDQLHLLHVDFSFLSKLLPPSCTAKDNAPLTCTPTTPGLFLDAPSNCRRCVALSLLTVGRL